MDNLSEIKTVEDLFIYGAGILNSEKFEPPNISEKLYFSLHIEGKSWDKRIDSRSAQYVVSLQKGFDDLLEEMFPEKKNEKIFVKIDTKEGSFLSEADITDIVKTAISNMTDTQTFILFLLGIAALGGYLWFARYLNYRKSLKEIDSDIEKEKQKNELLCNAIDALKSKAETETFSNYERPMRSVVKNLEEKDNVAIGNTNDKIPMSVAKKCSPPRAPRSETQITYADGEYIVNSRRYDEGEVVLELEQNGIKIKGYLWQLDDNDRDTFISSLDKHEKEDELPFYINIQMNIEHTQRVLKNGVILGEGAPREGKRCFKLNEILLKKDG